MGKYMKKLKIRGDLAPKDASQSSLGVRTRAKTLALQRLRSSAEPEPCFLELRSRRLEKPPLFRKNMQASEEDCLNFPEKEEFGNGSVPKEEEDVNRVFEIGDSEIEVSFGENHLESEAKEEIRKTRESTPCSLIRGSEGIVTPGSSSKSATLTPTNRRVWNARIRNMPTDDELEGFFLQMEEVQHQHFIAKYNFDIVNDLPLPGRYVWEKL